MRGFRIRPSGRIGPVTIGGLSIPGTRVCSPAPVAIRIRDSHGRDHPGRPRRHGPDMRLSGGHRRRALHAPRSAPTRSRTSWARGIVARPGLGRGHRPRPRSGSCTRRRDQALPGATPRRGSDRHRHRGRRPSARLRTRQRVHARCPMTTDDAAVAAVGGHRHRRTPAVRSPSGATASSPGRGATASGSSGRTGVVPSSTRSSASGCGDGYFLDELTGARIVGDDIEGQRHRHPAGAGHP